MIWLRRGFPLGNETEYALAQPQKRDFTIDEFLHSLLRDNLENNREKSKNDENPNNEKRHNNENIDGRNENNKNNNANNNNNITNNNNNTYPAYMYWSDSVWPGLTDLLTALMPPPPSSPQNNNNNQVNNAPNPGHGKSDSGVLSPRGNVWVGSAGVETHLHLDWSLNLHAQLTGTKRFVLYAPKDHKKLHLFPHLHSRHSKAQVFSPEDFDDTKRFTSNMNSNDIMKSNLMKDNLMKNNDDKINFINKDHEMDEPPVAFVGNLGACDVLFIPPLWFHEVTMLKGPGASVNIWSDTADHHHEKNVLKSPLPAMVATSHTAILTVIQHIIPGINTNPNKINNMKDNTNENNNANENNNNGESNNGENNANGNGLDEARAFVKELYVERYAPLLHGTEPISCDLVQHILEHSIMEHSKNPQQAAKAGRLYGQGVLQSLGGIDPVRLEIFLGDLTEVMLYSFLGSNVVHLPQHQRTRLIATTLLCI